MSDTSTPRKVSLELLEEIAAAFNSRDCDRIASYFTEDATFLTSGGTSPEGTRVSGKQAIRDFLAARFERIPDMRWEKLYEYVAGDDKAVSVWRVKGVSEDGTQLDYQGCDLWEFKDGLVHHKDTYWKNVTA